MIGGVQQTAALYDTATLDTSAISIIDDLWSNPFGRPAGPIQGDFTAILIAGLSPTLPGAQPVDVRLAQTGLVPVGTDSLEFKALTYWSDPSQSFAVSLGGQTLSLIPLQAGTNYTLYGADIHDWAGQTAELAFTAIAENPHVIDNYLYLDSIQFSTEPIPEPGVFALLALGVSVVGWGVLRRRP